METASIEVVMNTLIERRAKGVSLDCLADMFDRMLWLVDDNGAAILSVREQWLQSSDRLRVEVALAMRETFPFANQADMLRVFADIVDRWPDLAVMCAEIVRLRKSILDS